MSYLLFRKYIFGPVLVNLERKEITRNNNNIEVVCKYALFVFLILGAFNFITSNKIKSSQYQENKEGVLAHYLNVIIVALNTIDVY